MKNFKNTRIIETLLCMAIIMLIGPVPGIIGSLFMLALRKRILANNNNQDALWIWAVSVITGVLVGALIQISIIYIFKLHV